MPMRNLTKPFLSHLHFHLQTSKRSFYALISVVALCLLAYNVAAVFCAHLPALVLRKTSPGPEAFSPETVAGKSRKFFSLPEHETPTPTPRTETHFPLLHKNRSFGGRRKGFEARAKGFLSGCKLRFFMTWVFSPVESFGEREIFAISSLFKSNPCGSCLVIASDSFDSSDGARVLKPLVKMGFRVTAIAPDFSYLFEGTPAHEWYNRLMRGGVNPGEVSLGQNLSNLLRLGLLYKFGGIYVDTDVILLRSLGGLRNTIGAQTIDRGSKNWSRLNNAVMVFDEGHPLLYKFIQEFALTFDGSKWGHNGPYLVSRVVLRVNGRPGYNFTILPPLAFYPVDWSRIGSLFEGPKSLSHSKWLVDKLGQIRSRSFAVHLWNKHSRGIEVQKGSIIYHIMFGSGYNRSTQVCDY